MLGLAQATFKQWGEHKSARLAAALAYYTVFSIAPLLLIAIAVAGLVFGHDAASREILGQIGGLIGQRGEHQLTTMVAAANKPASGIIATVFGVVALILGATGVVIQLQDALDVVWEVKENPKKRIGADDKDKTALDRYVARLGLSYAGVAARGRRSHRDQHLLE